MKFVPKKILLAIPFCLSACVPVLVGGLIYKSSKSSGQKQEFMSQLQRTNADREARGLRPLDWCSEAYRFDKGWAWEDPNCRQRIKRYEKGDASALDQPNLPKSDSTKVTQSAIKRQPVTQPTP